MGSRNSSSNQWPSAAAGTTAGTTPSTCTSTGDTTSTGTSADAADSSNPGGASRCSPHSTNTTATRARQGPDIINATSKRLGNRAAVGAEQIFSIWESFPQVPEATYPAPGAVSKAAATDTGEGGRGEVSPPPNTPPSHHSTPAPAPLLGAHQTWQRREHPPNIAHMNSILRQDHSESHNTYSVEYTRFEAEIMRARELLLNSLFHTQERITTHTLEPHV